MSKLSQLFVIARNSSFSFKGRNVQVREIGKTLGVRYVLEGSVRKAGERVQDHGPADRRRRTTAICGRSASTGT